MILWSKNKHFWGLIYSCSLITSAKSCDCAIYWCCSCLNQEVSGAADINQMIKLVTNAMMTDSCYQWWLTRRELKIMCLTSLSFISQLFKFQFYYITQHFLIDCHSMSDPESGIMGDHGPSLSPSQCPLPETVVTSSSVTLPAPLLPTLLILHCLATTTVHCTLCQLYKQL